MGDKVAAAKPPQARAFPPFPQRAGWSRPKRHSLVETTGFPRDDQGCGGAAAPRHPHRALGRGVSYSDAAGQAEALAGFGDGGL